MSPAGCLAFRDASLLYGLILAGWRAMKLKSSRTCYLCRLLLLTGCFYCRLKALNIIWQHRYQCHLLSPVLQYTQGTRFFERETTLGHTDWRDYDVSKKPLQPIGCKIREASKSSRSAQKGKSLTDNCPLSHLNRKQTGKIISSNFN